MFLPLAHSLARVTQMVVLDVGGTIAYWRGDPKVVLEDLPATRPTHVPSVPRVFEKVHTKALGGVEEAGPRSKRAIFHWALEHGPARARARAPAARSPGALLRGSHALADRLVLSKVRGLFGPDIKLALTGAAPIAAGRARVLRRLRRPDARGLRDDRDHRCGDAQHAGALPLRHRRARAARRRGLDRRRTARCCMRGPHVFAGYFRNDGGDARDVHDGRLAAVGRPRARSTRTASSASPAARRT